MAKEALYIDLDKILLNKAPRLYRCLPRFVIAYLKHKLHIKDENDILSRFASSQGVDFMNDLVSYFNISLDVSGLDKIDCSGRYIFVANHPLGGLDGICLSSIIGSWFDHKIKYVVNDILFYITNLQPIFLPINKHGRQSRSAAKMITGAYESDDQILTFPAGLCSRMQQGEIVDMKWHKNFILNAIQYQRTVVPVYFEGRNSRFFYRLASWRKKLGIKANIEMFFLPDEMFKSRNKRFSVIFGQPISYTVFDKEKSYAQWAEYVKMEVYKLAKIKE